MIVTVWRAVALMGQLLLVPVRQGEQTVELCLRTVAKPDRLVAEVLTRLSLRLPTRSRKVENVVGKTTL
jgi:hypothetical protein